MILFKWNKGQYFRNFLKRSILEVTIHSGLLISIESQYLAGDKDWRTNWVHFAIGFQNFWSWGSRHGWYDGPHCSFSLGFLHFYWEGGLWSGHCDKCENN